MAAWKLKSRGRPGEREYSIRAVTLSALWIALVAGFATQSSLSSQALDAEKLPVVKLPPGGPGAATNLVAKPDCDPANPRRGIARLYWTPAAKPGREQRVAMTTFADGFELQRFEVSRSLRPGETNFTWDKVRGGAVYHWRVLTLQPEGWLPSHTARFDGPDCFVDPITDPRRREAPKANQDKK